MAEQELNGYGEDDELPDYRSHRGMARGLFVSNFGGMLNDQPLAPAFMDENHRHLATDIRLLQPIEAYDRKKDDDKSGSFIFAWPANIVAYYQSKFLKGGWTLKSRLDGSARHGHQGPRRHGAHARPAIRAANSG